MNWRLGILVLAAIPVLCLAFWGLTRLLAPLAGFALGMVLYWALIGVAILHSTTPAERAALTTWRSPGRLLSAIAFVPVLILAWIALDTLQIVTLPPWVFLLIAVGALANGTLEEMFWRGAILPNPDREGIAVALGLFTIWHVALLFAHGIEMRSGPAAVLLGALIMGAIWTAMRLRTGTVGAALAGHVAFNLFAFTDLVGGNWPASA